MDVEKLKKMNELTREFQKHNFAQDSRDAFSQARNVYSDIDINFAPTNIATPAQVVVHAAPQTEAVQEAAMLQQPAAEKDALFEAKFQLLTEELQKKHNAEVNVLSTTIAGLNDEISSLKLQLQRLQEQSKPQQKEKQEQLAAPAKEAHPRHGNFKPEDVAIEKMFYFGAGGK